MSISVGIYGATGYTGLELVRLLHTHPEVDIRFATSESSAGQSLRQLWPQAPALQLVAAADACSASRPGARRETLERYVKRMEELEGVAGGFPGVDQAFAIQAGREIRVIVSAKETTDETAAKTCRDIVKAFEERLTYPGEIKVTVLRETRYTEVAR